jgi:hypothetical protein
MEHWNVVLRWTAPHLTELRVGRTHTFYLPVGQLDLPRLRSMPADVAADLARRAHSGDLFSAQRQDGLQSLYLDFVNHVLHDLAGAFDQIDQRQQDLSVGLAPTVLSCAG